MCLIGTSVRDFRRGPCDQGVGDRDVDAGGKGKGRMYVDDIHAYYSITCAYYSTIRDVEGQEYG